MVFTKGNKRHRQTGMNAFDKKITRSILSIAGTGLLISSMTAASAAPSENNTQIKKAAEVISETDVVVSQIADSIESQVVQIPVVEVSEAEIKTPDVPQIEIIPKPEPKPVVKEKPVENIVAIIEENPDKSESEDSKDKVESGQAEAIVEAAVPVEKEDEETNVIGFAAPLNSMNVSSSFGYRIHPVYGTSKLHEGTDLNASCGTPVYASADGTVVQSGYKNGRAGNVVEIDHGIVDGSQMSSSYYHLSNTIAQNGSFVKQGDLIGEVGTTGTSTGCHLHWAATVNGEKTDPMPYLRK